jgi:dTDP-4-amino-4,6-dideoxygalactose transaminase
MSRLNDQGISTRQGTHAVHALGYYRANIRSNPWDYPKAWIAEHLSLVLPLYPQTHQEQAFVCHALKRGLRA